MHKIPTYLTHYYESEYGPFRNICDLPDTELDAFIEKEKNSVTDFNRFAIGREFFRNRCEADDLLIQLYERKWVSSYLEAHIWIDLDTLQQRGETLPS